MKHGEILSIRDQEKVLFTILASPSYDAVKTFQTALNAGCTFTGPIALYVLCSEKWKPTEVFVGCIHNFTTEALDVIREYEKGRNPQFQHFWICCVGSNGTYAPNALLAYELYPEQTMKRFCERKQWDAIKKLLAYYKDGMSGDEDTESHEANQFYHIYSYIDSYVPQDIKSKYEW
ncbi:MAG: hypothetical protein E7019_03710 [Alphaproteobacteria bacterium]|nr:hypothetical protein [Alphaproteobacteria bacterium]